ncbi:hypothetical protein DGI_2120 [Megalodesulfovibrio gigas DSM 1382 = ATCC 19364]|uniref:Uncharacterized protein n=1 Tax=Megalodesulfovibrio gigas (strain ATCC 19364 / DSM 1382 / NCIMB 9332 / VKM B-1759) TaxID=1121448 RepID=T2GCH3_MEGG1|nr:hypothetical protein DGI_2120 [Megalodesulfovibrio gigas DSM 1382 = ATCC 19364]
MAGPSFFSWAVPSVLSSQTPLSCSMRGKRARAGGALQCSGVCTPLDPGHISVRLGLGLTFEAQSWHCIREMLNNI